VIGVCFAARHLTIACSLDGAAVNADQSS